MSKVQVLCVGNCLADHAALSSMLEREFEVAVARADTASAAHAAAQTGEVALVLINRILDADGSSGIDLVRKLRAVGGEPTVMLISNHADAQREATAAGASPGFGKRALDGPKTAELLAEYLPRRNS